MADKEVYESGGKQYRVGPNSLEKFKKDHPNATKVEAPKKGFIEKGFDATAGAVTSLFGGGTEKAVKTGSTDNVGNQSVYEVDGKQYNVGPNSLEKFQRANPNAVKISGDDPGVSGGTVAKRVAQSAMFMNPFTRTASVAWMAYDAWEDHETADMKHKQEGAHILENFSYADDNGVPKKVNHLDANAFVEATSGEGIFGMRKEGNAVELLNSFYKEANPDLNIRFVESKRGKDAVELLFGDQKEGQGKEFDLDSDFGIDFSQGWQEFIGKGDEAFTNEDVFENIKRTIDNAINPELEAASIDAVLDNIDIHNLFLSNNPDNKVQFLNNLDEKSGALFQDPDQATLGDPFATTTSRFIVDPTDTKGFGESVLWGTSFGQHDSRKVNMTGSLTFEDENGEVHKVPYKHIWDNREVFQQAAQQRSMVDHSERLIIEHGEGKYSYDPNNILTGVKSEGVYAVEEGWMNNILSGEDKWFDETLTVSNRIKAEKEGDNREDIIKADTERLESLLKERGIKPLYDKDGFLDIEKLNEEIQATETKEETEANLLADDHPASVLADMRHQEIVKLMAQSEIALSARDDVEGSINWFIRKAGGVLGPNLFEPLGAAMDAIAGDNKPKVRGEDIRTDMLYLENIVNSGSLKDLDRLPELAGDSPAAVQFNETVKNLRTISKALAINSDPTKMKRDNLIGEIVDDLSYSFTGERIISDHTRNMEVEAFSYMLEDAGYFIPGINAKEGDYERQDITPGSPGEWTFSGALTNARRATEATSQVITDMGPLLLELYLFKKASPRFMTTMTKGVERTAAIAARRAKRLAGKLNKNWGRSTTLPKSYKWLTRNVVAPGVATTAEWAIAESIGEHTMGWKAQTIDWETGETRFTFPFAMGASGKLFSQLQANVWKNLKVKSPKLAARLENVSTTSLTSSKYKKVLQPVANLVGKSVGQGATATALLTVSEGAQLMIGSLIEDGNLGEAEEWKELFDPKHLMTTWAAMSVLSGQKLLPEFRSYVRESILSLDMNTRASAEASETLGLTHESNRRKDGGYRDSRVDRSSESRQKKIDKQANKDKNNVDKETRKQLDKVNKSKELTDTQKRRERNKIGKEGAKKKRKIDAGAKKSKGVVADAAKALKLHNDVIATQKSARADRKWEEYLMKETRKFDLTKKRDLTNEEREEYAELDRGDIEKMLYMKGHTPGSAGYEYYMQEHSVLKHFTALANGARLQSGKNITLYGKNNPAARRKFIQDGVNAWKNQYRIESLKKEMKENPGDTATKMFNKNRLETLEKQGKEFQEQVDANFKNFEKWVEKNIDLEIAAAKIMGEKIGAKGEWDVLDNNSYRDKIEKLGLGKEAMESEGVFIEETGEIILNRDKMKELVSLGTATHELLHRVLKESLKVKNKNGERVISPEGKKLIEDFLDRLPKKDRAVLEERIEENYKYQEFTQEKWDQLSAKEKARYKKPEGVGGQLRAEVKEEYYYEEYLTAFGDALKEGLIKFDKSSIPSEIGDPFYDILKEVAPNLGKGRQGGTRSFESGKELHEFLTTFHAYGEVIKSKIEAGEVIPEGVSYKTKADIKVKKKSKKPKKKPKPKSPREVETENRRQLSEAVFGNADVIGELSGMHGVSNRRGGAELQELVDYIETQVKNYNTLNKLGTERTVDQVIESVFEHFGIGRGGSKGKYALSRVAMNNAVQLRGYIKGRAAETTPKAEVKAKTVKLSKRTRVKKVTKVEQPSDIINKFAEGIKTQAEWKESEGVQQAVKALKPGGVIYNRIADKSKGLSKEKIAETVEAFRDRLKNFDPQAKRKTDSKEPITLNEFVNANIGFGKLVAAKELFKQSEQTSRTQRIDETTSEGKQAFELEAERDASLEAFEEADMSMMAQIRRAKLEAEGELEADGPSSPWKKFVFKNNALANPSVSSAELTNKTVGTVQTALKTSGSVDAVKKGNPKVFLSNLESTFGNSLTNTVRDTFGKGNKYKEFYKSEETFKMIKTLPVSALVRAGMEFAYEPVIDPSTGKQKRMTVDEMSKAGYPTQKFSEQAKEIKNDKSLTKAERNKKLKELDKTGSGPAVWELKDFTQQDYINWAEAKDINPKTNKPWGSGTKGNRKTATAKMVGVELAKDATPSVLAKPFQQAFDLNGNAKMKDGKPVKIDLLKELNTMEKVELADTALSNRINEIIRRDPTAKFSFKKKVDAFEKEQLGLGFTERIENLNKPENADIKKYYDKESQRLFSTDYETQARKMEMKMWEEQTMYDLEYAQAEKILSGEQLKELTELADNSRTESDFKKVIKRFNKENPGLNIPIDTQKFAFGTKGKEARENFFKRQGDIYDLLPAEFFNNPKLVTALFKTGGLGSLITRMRFKADGTPYKPGVKQKLAPRGKKGDPKYMLDNFGRPLTGNAKIEVPMIKDAKGNLRPLTDAMNIAQIGAFKAGKKGTGKRKGEIVQDGMVQFHEKNKNLSKKEYQKKLFEWGRENLGAKDFTYEQTEQANKYVRDTLAKALVEYAYAPKMKVIKAGKETMVKMTKAEFAERINVVTKFLQIQTNIGEGLIKGLNTIRYLTLGKPTPSKYSPTGYHAEHAYFNLAHTASFVHLLSKHRKSGSVKDFMKDYEGISANMEQFVIQEQTRQGNEGRQADGTIYGNTEFFKGGNVFSKLNVLSSNPRIAFEIVDLRTGKTIGETMSKNLQIGEAESIALARALGKNLNLVTKGEKKFDKVDEANKRQLTGVLSKKTVKKMTFEETTDAIKMVNKALANGRKTDGKKKGMSTFDFDETLIIKGENFVTATKGKNTIKISSENFPLEGPKLEAQGYKFDFKDFVNVKGGVEGPLFKKLQKQIDKYGSENVFVLTARMQESAPAIHAWLKSKGVELPIKNITGLGKSTGEAKGLWMLEKFAEGYNDMYFVDDAMSNVKAVKRVLDQLDVKSDVQQVRYSIKKNLNADVNKMMEHSLGIDAGKTFSKAEGRMRGKDAKRRKLFLPDTAADLDLLLEPLYGKGKQGIKNKEWFDKNFYKPFERGVNDFNSAKQKLTNEYMTLRKGNKDIVKNLGKEVEGTSFTHDQAMRVYLWNKAGFKIPDLAETTKQRLIDYVENNAKYKAYAESFNEMRGGLKEPSAEWWSETIATEISDINRGVGRKEFLADFIELRKEIFSEENLNKMESKLGKNWRDTIEDMFDRMETGRSRSENISGVTAELVNYFNGSVGTIMNFNTRSGLLQLISSVNFVNSSFNNPLKAAQAFANQKQYWKDFMTILNSDMLKQRRDGLEINVTEAEIASAAAGSKNPAKAVIAKILKAGYLPTKIADSVAIATGGAMYYRNAVNNYMRQGMSRAKAEKKAFIDFQALAERTQQSSRPDLISKQQTTLGGRLILPFANTPLQMNRLAMKEMLDISKGRYKNKADLADKLGKIGYYGFIQTAIFAGLQSAAFAVFANSDDDDLKAKKKTQMLDTIMDSTLRGMGIAGSVLNGIIKSIREFYVQKEKGYGADYSEVAEDLLSISPPVGSKFRMLDAAGNTYKYNKKQIEEEGVKFSLDSPGLQATTQATEAITNVPVNRVFKKLNNLKNAADNDYAVWQRVLMSLGWSNWDVDPDLAKQKSKDSKKDDASKKQKKKKGKVKHPKSYY